MPIALNDEFVYVWAIEGVNMEILDLLEVWVEEVLSDLAL